MRFWDDSHALVAGRWPDGVVKCPRCGSDRVTYLASARVWKCYEPHPRAKFPLKVGTVLEDSPLPLQKCLPALWLLTNCKNGISSYELARARQARSQPRREGGRLTSAPKCSSASSASIQGHVRPHVEPGANHNTDSFFSYSARRQP